MSVTTSFLSVTACFRIKKLVEYGSILIRNKSVYSTRLRICAVVRRQASLRTVWPFGPCSTVCEIHKGRALCPSCVPRAVGIDKKRGNKKWYSEKKTERQCTYKRNIEARSRNHRCPGTLECISLGLVTGMQSTRAVLYEGWNFNSGNYLFTTDTK